MEMQPPDRRPLSASERQMIEGEHARLEKFLGDLRTTCCNFDLVADCQSCAREKIASCHGQLVSFTHDFLELVIEHCENEEDIMSEVFIAHQSHTSFLHHRQEHVKLVRSMESLMLALPGKSRQGHTAAALREFHARATEAFSKHSREFDATLLQPWKQGIQENGETSNA